MNAILEGLNEEQRKAVQCVEGPVLIVAGAGSGKTRVLTSRVAYALALGCEPERILALTFTKKAATEMKERIATMVGHYKARKVVMGTFHSVFVRFLRDYAESIGYPKQFTIYDQSDSQSAVKTCIKEMGLDDKVYKPKEVLSRISMAKNSLITVGAYRNTPQLMAEDLHSKKPRLGEIYELYQARLKQNGVMDFDDILVNMNILLRDNAAALEEISSRFSYIMVDEYQDTNVAQYKIIQKLSRRHHNICVVGDDSQSIYAFRGARIENILNFRKDYPDHHVFRLERNYRSTRNIVNAANSVIARNEGRIPKECYSMGEDGEPIRLIKAYNESDEASRIVGEIMDRMRTDHARYEEFAILYRTNSQSRAFEDQLRRRNIPYIIYSGNSFFERAEVKDMMAYFKLVVNVNDDESFKRIVNKPARAIGDTSVSALAEVARAHGCTLFKAAYMPDAEVYGLKPAAQVKIKLFCEMIDRLAASVATTDCFELARRIADESGLYAFYKSDNSIEGQSRTANVEELINSVQLFVEERHDEMADAAVEGEAPVFDTVTLDDYLENVSLLSNVDATADDENDSNKVALMTVHSAKGLEFPYVFIVGLEENIFPSGGMLLGPREVEEERRLFYVALTRARKDVMLSFASERMRNGKHESNSVSRFVREIDSKYIENPLVSDDDDDSDDDSEGFSFGFGKRFGSGFGSRSGFGGGASSGYGNRQGSGSRSGFGGGSSSGYGSRQGSAQGSYRYGQSGKVTFESRGAASPFGGAKPASSNPGAASSRPVQPGRPVQTVKPGIIDPDFVPVDMRELREGERVEHNRFGKGLIKTITGTYPEMKATIVFDDYGEKLLLLKYAKLRPEA